MSERIVKVSRAYSIFYWLEASLLIVLGLFALVIPGILLLVGFIWHKKAVVNRSRFIHTPGAKTITVQRGRWFVLDDDAVPVRSIDNIKLDRSVLGRLFGWCHVHLETRSEGYKLRHVATSEAEDFRRNFLDGL